MFTKEKKQQNPISRETLLPFCWDWFWSVPGWSRDEDPGAEEEGQSWTDKSSPAGRGARPASSVDSPVCSSAERRGNAPRPERNDGLAWRNDTELSNSNRKLS